MKKTAAELLNLKDKEVLSLWRSKADGQVNFVLNGRTVSTLSNTPSSLGKLVYFEESDAEEIADSALIEVVPVDRDEDAQ